MPQYFPITGRMQITHEHSVITPVYHGYVYIMSSSDSSIEVNTQHSVSE